MQPDWCIYPFAVMVVNDIEQLSFHLNITFFISENGLGKSTIMETIEGGTLNVRFNSVPSSALSLFQ